MKISKASLALIIIGCLTAGIGLKVAYDNFINPDKIEVEVTTNVFQEIGNLDHVRTRSYFKVYVNDQYKFSTVAGLDDWLNSHDIKHRGVEIASKQEVDFNKCRYYIRLDKTDIDLIPVGSMGEN